MVDSTLFKPGHTACAGCGQAQAVRLVIDAAGSNTIVANNTGCLEVFSTRYPETAWNVPWIHSLFENAAAVASGIEAALIYLGKKEITNVIAQAGDGGTADIGLQALSGMWERGHDILYVCLPPETELILGDGTIVEIGEFVDKIILQQGQDSKRLIYHCENIAKRRLLLNSYNRYTDSNLIIPVKEKEEIEDTVVEIAPVEDKTVLSWDKLQFLPQRILCVQRKTSGDTLVKITTASGLILTLTPEHPVLIDTLDGPKWQRADLLKMKDEVYALRRFTLNIEKDFYLVDFLTGNIKVKLSLETKEKINQELVKNYGNVKEAAKTIGFKYWQFKEKNRLVDLWALRKIFRKVSSLKWEELREEIVQFGVQGGNPIKIKQNKFTPDLLYLLGLITSDGYLGDKDYVVGFTNKEEVLIKEFKKRYRKLFSGRKISEFKDKQGIIGLIIANPILSLLGKNLQIKSNPKTLIGLPQELICAYLRGFFDGDGYCGITKNRHSCDAKVIFSTIEEKLAKRLRQMLQRIGIACFQDSRENRFDLIISSKEDIERFIDKVSTRHPLQKKRMGEIKKLWKTRKQRGRFFSIAPKVCGKILKEICEKEGIPITKLDKKRNICSLAAGVRRATKQRIKEYKEDLLRLIGKEKVSLFKNLESQLRDDFYLDPIEKIETVPCKSKFVYDITVENTHLFVPEGVFIVSNCYDNEAYENTGIQRSGLTPYGANTTTSPPGTQSIGNIRPKKPMPEIANAHGIPYVATASVGFPQDLQRKVKKAISIKGPKYMQIHVPCPLGWRHETQLTYQIAKLAVETGLYPLIEYENGKLVAVRKISPKPVEEYLRPQGRFKHLLTNPQELKKIQEIADNNIEKYNLRAESTQE
jgi:pyruvate/2-oxoacid:ferredoxin oxidoreductase beta subunit/intein/homing endonuclease